MIKRSIYNEICNEYGRPEIDLFASRINAQEPIYCSFKPDPYAKYIDAFSIPWNAGTNYLFPPFSCLGRALRKLRLERGTAIVVLPLWPSQTWFPAALNMATRPPVILPARALTLPQDPELQHPLKKLVLAAMTLSGDTSEAKRYRSTLPSSSPTRGGREPYSTTGTISRGGCSFVSNGKLFHFRPL